MNGTITELCPFVEPIEGEPLRYHVRSRSRPRVKHLVDLSAHDGLGQCSCERWAFVVSPMLKDGYLLDKAECRHVVMCRRYLAIQVARKASETWKEKGKT